MMQDVLVIRRKVNAIRHSEKHASMTIEEWKSIHEIARSTIHMHLVVCLAELASTQVSIRHFSKGVVGIGC